MNPLLNAEDGALYTEDCKLITRIRFSREDSSFIFIFSDKPENDIPGAVYLMPDSGLKDYTSFLCTITGKWSEYYVPQTETTWYLLEAETRDLPEFYTEFRVNVSFPLNISPIFTSTNVLVTVIDISVGGFKFTSNTSFETGSTFSFIFSRGRHPVVLSARVVRARPSCKENLYCYGCQFLNVDTKAESVLRGFVFKENLIQARAKELF